MTSLGIAIRPVFAIVRREKPAACDGNPARATPQWAHEYRQRFLTDGSDFPALSVPAFPPANHQFSRRSHKTARDRYPPAFPWISSACWKVGRLTHSIRGWLIAPMARNWMESWHSWSPAWQGPSAGLTCEGALAPAPARELP